MTKAPVCKLCQKAHWSYEPHGDAQVPEYVRKMAAINSPQGAINTAPAINEERLTSAINPPAVPPVGEEASTHLNHGGAREVGESLRGPLRRVRSGGEVPSRLEAPRRTPNRRSRQDYNAYMREYMRRRREHLS